MGVKRVVEYEIICDADGCEKEYDWRLFDSKTDAIRTVRDEGWGYDRRRKLVFCPAHNDFDNG